jgi:hypothetical protein
MKSMTKKLYCKWAICRLHGFSIRRAKMEQFIVTQPDLDLGFLTASKTCKGDFLLRQYSVLPAESLPSIVYIRLLGMQAVSVG